MGLFTVQFTLNHATKILVKAFSSFILLMETWLRSCGEVEVQEWTMDPLSLLNGRGLNKLRV